MGSGRKRVREDKARHPLRLIEYSQAVQKIDFDALSIRNNKRVQTVTLYADVTGFTAYIDGMTTEADQQEALRLFHVIRRETSRIIRKDYEGVRVQFQGDRVQAIFHIPAGLHADYTLEAVICAGALQASLEKVIRPLFPSAADLHLAIGCDLGQITATNLGARGHRDRICLGRSVEAAAAREEALDGGHTGISNEMYALLPAALQKVFVHDAAKACYVARNPTVIVIKRLLEADGWRGGDINIMPGQRGVSVQPATTAAKVAAGVAAATAVAGRTAKASSSYVAQSCD